VSRQIRETTVRSQPARFFTSSASIRASRSQVSWTASSASPSDPSMRYAIARMGPRCSSNRSASSSCPLMGHLSPSCSVTYLTYLTRTK
jgi:hypothetical protein